MIFKSLQHLKVVVVVKNNDGFSDEKYDDSDESDDDNDNDDDVYVGCWRRHNDGYNENTFGNNV